MLAGKSYTAFIKEQNVNGAKLHKYLRLNSFEQDRITLKKMLDNLEASKKIVEFINKIEDIGVVVQMNRLLKETQNTEKAVNKALNEMELPKLLLTQYKLLCLRGNLNELYEKPMKKKMELLKSLLKQQCTL